MLWRHTWQASSSKPPSTRHTPRGCQPPSRHPQQQKYRGIFQGHADKSYQLKSWVNQPEFSFPIHLHILKIQRDFQPRGTWVRCPKKQEPPHPNTQHEVPQYLEILNTLKCIWYLPIISIVFGPCYKVSSTEQNNLLFSLSHSLTLSLPLSPTLKYFIIHLPKTEIFSYTIPPSSHLRKSTLILSYNIWSLLTFPQLSYKWPTELFHIQD